MEYRVMSMFQISRLKCQCNDNHGTRTWLTKLLTVSHSCLQFVNLVVTVIMPVKMKIKQFDLEVIQVKYVELTATLNTKTPVL